jgi:hypothetical protein
MLPPETAERLSQLGHDAVSVHAAGLTGANDAEVFSFAVSEARVVVTENFADYASILEQRQSRADSCVPVVFVRKATLPRGGALAAHLADRLHSWAVQNPEPYAGAHWP